MIILNIVMLPPNVCIMLIFNVVMLPSNVCLMLTSNVQLLDESYYSIMLSGPGREFINKYKYIFVIPYVHIIKHLFIVELK